MLIVLETDLVIMWVGDVSLNKFHFEELDNGKCCRGFCLYNLELIFPCPDRRRQFALVKGCFM